MFNRREVLCRWAVNAAVDRNVPRTAHKLVHLTSDIRCVDYDSLVHLWFSVTLKWSFFI